MKVFVCIDDTDNLDSRGTGELATIISKAVVDHGWGKCEPVTRHQLFLHPDIPYTSHNSSMCFPTDMDEQYLNTLIDYASNFLETESAEGSAPGLCVACVDQIKDLELLLTFGQRAKSEVLTKENAYELAKKLGIHLSEHGETGQGIIGALAGVGLRLTGNDGRMKGKLKIESVNNQASVRDILAQTKIDSVKSLSGMVLENDELVNLENDWVKVVLLDGKLVLPVSPRNTDVTAGTKWQLCTKQQLKDF